MTTSYIIDSENELFMPEDDYCMLLDQLNEGGKLQFVASAKEFDLLKDGWRGGRAEYKAMEAALISTGIDIHIDCDFDTKTLYVTLMDGAGNN